jgi:hypothetical protein
MALPRVFISMRVSENRADGAAAQLMDALEAVGISCFVCGGTPVGDNIAADIACALDACELLVVLGTEEYGTQGESQFSTREELQFAVDHDKPIFLVKRCDEFADPLTRFHLPASMLCVEWAPFTGMPLDLVDKIVSKLETAAIVNAQKMWVNVDARFSVV